MKDQHLKDWEQHWQNGNHVDDHVVTALFERKNAFEELLAEASTIMQAGAVDPELFAQWQGRVGELVDDFKERSSIE